jgi:hypothetical protein
MFIGDWFSWNDVQEEYEFYCATLLVLLQPWRTIIGLKTKEGTFKQAFNMFVSNSDNKTKDIIENIQYQHECTDSTIKK